MNNFKTSISTIVLILTILCFASCTAIQFKPIAQPSPESKLRVATLLIFGNPGKYGWARTHEESSNWISKTVNEQLRDTGIYEVVP